MPTTVFAARRAVMIAFFLNGFGFATWVSRIPAVRAELELSNGRLGQLLLVIAVGSVLTLPTAGALINRIGAAHVVRVGVIAAVFGLGTTAIGTGVLQSVPVVGVGLFCYGVGIGLWDVAMNVEGAAVERELGRTIMPVFHALFSLGAVAGAVIGAVATGVGMSLVAHVVPMAVLMFVLAQVTVGNFLPRDAVHAEGVPVRGRALRAWLEPRTILIGLMVFALAVTEGTANDWLAVALVDGYAVPHWVGVAGFVVFVSSMTAARMFGSVLVDRWGRALMLWSTMAAAIVGVLLIVVGGHPAIVSAGIVLWGAGASLGFPVGISAAADDPAHAAVRVSVVSTIAYLAFLAGPPLLGVVADHIGTLNALLVVAVLLVPSALLVPAAAPRAVSAVQSD
ncbi:MFS transporter [Smaragdicoccus niigatensis]|uniref:MFS transporter n=1 Tax=Smaragdicoccus niigatensis TaxID=359359 RepID=UPI00036B6692|nr:MFS transporter [Smaragdicoccus niigatensis]